MFQRLQSTCMLTSSNGLSRLSSRMSTNMHSGTSLHTRRQYVCRRAGMPLPADQACSRRSMTAGVSSEGSLARSAAQMTSLSSRSYVCDAV